jgi:hypothetical protein
MGSVDAIRFAPHLAHEAEQISDGRKAGRRARVQRWCGWGA